MLNRIKTVIQHHTITHSIKDCCEAGMMKMLINKLGVKKRDCCWL